MLTRAFREDFFVYGILGVFSKSASLIALPLFASKLSPSDFGLLDAFALTLALLALIGSLQVESALLRFLPDAANEREQASVYWSGLFLLLALSTGISIIVLVFTPSILHTTNYSEHTTALSLCLAAQLPLSLLFGYNTSLFRAQRRKSIYVFLNAFNIGTSIALGLFYIFQMDGDVFGLIACNTLALALVSALSVATARVPTLVPTSASLLRVMLQFSTPLLPVSLAIYAQQWLSRLAILMSLGPADAGIFSIAFRVASPFLLVANTLKVSWTPLVYQSHREKTFRYDSNQIVFGITLLGTLSLLVVALFADEAVDLLFDERYTSAAGLVHLIALSFYLKAISIYVAPMLGVGKKTGIIGVTAALGTTLSLLCMLALIPIYGLAGAAIAAIIGECASLAALVVSSGHHIQRYMSRAVLLVAIAVPMTCTLAVSSWEFSFTQEILLTLGATIAACICWLAVRHRAVRQR
jgi:O-antigen/teichoic acid export membrane protein